MLPEIKTLPAFKIAGFAYSGNNANNEIIELWNRFLEVANTIPGADKRTECYGVCAADPVNPDGMDYMACLQVDDFENLPEEMSTGEVPAQTYAVFSHKGAIEKIQDTYSEIFCNWPKDLPYSIDEFAVFVEMYDARFDSEDSENSEMFIYVPVKPR